jgi:hypothetical protein
VDTPNADRFMALLAMEYQTLIDDAHRRIRALTRSLELYNYTAYNRELVEREIAFHQSNIHYYSKGAENEDEFLTAEPAETPEDPKTYILITEDMCILGL